MGPFFFQWNAVYHCSADISQTCQFCTYAQMVNLPATRETQVQSLGLENDNPLQYSCLENPMDRGAWRAAAHAVTKSQKLLSDFLIYYFY